LFSVSITWGVFLLPSSSTEPKTHDDLQFSQDKVAQVNLKKKETELITVYLTRKMSNISDQEK